MRKAVALLPLFAACAVLLVACGDSGSGSSSSANVATVPSGNLAAAPGEKCGVPTASGVHFNSVVPSAGVSCATAIDLIGTLVRNSRSPGWDCPQKPSGTRGTRVTCTNQADTTLTVSSSWSVS